MRVVLDKNVLVRAASSTSGPAFEVLRLVRAERHTLISSPFLLAELERVLLYPRLKALHKMSIEAISQFVEDIDLIAELVQMPSSAADAISRDPDDDFVLQTAIAGSAEVVCTRDTDLLTDEVRAYAARYGFQILTDLDLLATLRPKST